MSLAAAIELEWGPVADTAGDTITAWRHPTLAQPTQAELDVAMAKYAKHELTVYANAKRDSVALGGFVYDTATYDSDPLSVAKISGAAIQASEAKSAGAPFSITWTDAGGVDHTLNAQQMLDMQAALVAHADSAHQTCRQVKADIDAGTITTEAEIEGADWP